MQLPSIPSMSLIPLPISTCKETDNASIHSLNRISSLWSQVYWSLYPSSHRAKVLVHPELVTILVINIKTIDANIAVVIIWFPSRGWWIIHLCILNSSTCMFFLGTGHSPGVLVSDDHRWTPPKSYSTGKVLIFSTFWPCAFKSSLKNVAGKIHQAHSDDWHSSHLFTRFLKQVLIWLNGQGQGSLYVVTHQAGDAPVARPPPPPCFVCVGSTQRTNVFGN